MGASVVLKLGVPADPRGVAAPVSPMTSNSQVITPPADTANVPEFNRQPSKTSLVPVPLTFSMVNPVGTSSAMVYVCVYGADPVVDDDAPIRL